MELRLRVPRPQHQDSDLEEQEAWKKKLKAEVTRVQRQHPDAVVEIWCEDEHRIGLQRVMRRVWVEAGEIPIATVNWKRVWLWLYAFVQPQTGETKGVAVALCQHRFVQSSAQRRERSISSWAKTNG